MPFHIVLYQPVIPQNTGSIARLCACTGARLHLIRPLGFEIDERAVRRAGLDYWPHVNVQDYADWNEFLAKNSPERLYFYTKFATRSYTSHTYRNGDYLVFGSETNGLPEEIHREYRELLCKIPMRTHLVRSLNLSQSAAIVLYEALRQTEFQEIDTKSE